MGATKTNFQKAPVRNSNLREQFEQLAINAGAKGSFMVFKLADSEKTPFAESSLNV